MATMTHAAKRWLALIREQDASGLTANAFAQRQGLNAKTYAWWRRRLRRDGHLNPAPPSAFVEVTEVVPDQRRGHVIVRLDRHAASVVVGGDTDLGLVRALLEALC
jgi:hypothetical protein